MPGFTLLVTVAACASWLFLAPPSLYAQSEKSGEGSEQDRLGWYFHGSLDLRSVYRTDNENDDADLYQSLSLSFGQNGKGRLSGYVSARVSQDLDGRESPSDSFSSIADTHDRFYARLNAAYVDVRFDDLLDTIRLGRQWLSEVPEVVSFDGARARTRPLDDLLKTRLVLYAGIPEHFEESSRSEDRILGGGLEFHPLAMTRIAAYYSRIRDEYGKDIRNNNQEATFDDDLISLELRQLFFEGALSFSGLYTNLNGDSRESRVRFAYNAEDGKTRVGVNYRTLFSTQTSLSTEMDPFVSILRDYQPYNELSIDLSRDFTDHFGIDAGSQLRRLREDRGEGPFNHDFERYYLSGLVRKWPFDVSFITVTGDLYDANGDRFWIAEGSYEHKIGDDLTLKAGTGYSLYHENRFTFEENTHVRSGFLRMNYDLFDNVTLKAGYEIERDDHDTTHTVETSLRFRF